jgi:hypothetical protein
MAKNDDLPLPSVGPDQTHSLPGMHLETDVLEEHLATATKADVVEV